MTCQADARCRARQAASALRDQDAVLSVAVRDPTSAPVDRWTVAFQTRSRAPVDSDILEVLAEHGLGLESAPPRGDGRIVIAVVE